MNYFDLWYHIYFVIHSNMSFFNFQNEDQFTTKLLHTFLLDKENIDNTFYHQEMFNIICSSWNIKISNIKAVILASNNDALHQVVVSCLSALSLLVQGLQGLSMGGFINKLKQIWMKLYFFFLFYFYKLTGWVPLPMYSYPSIVFNCNAKCTLVSPFF